MANAQTALETIFTEAAKVFGKSDAEKLLKKVFEDEKPAKEEKKSKKEEKPKTETTKRISRMTPTLATQLKAELIKVGMTISDDDKKEFDKIKKEFVAHVDGLTDEDFTAKGLADHMRDFANLKRPAPVAEEEEEEEKPVAEKPKKGKAKDPAEEKPKKGKAAAGEKKKLWDEMSEVDAPAPPSDMTKVNILTLDELKKIEMLATPKGGPMGVYWDADDGRWVRGPEEDDDEDLTEKKFKGKTYAVGDNTGRVYETTDDRDIFVGFAGVGAFREMK
jgi:hypothetical protein